MVVATHDRPALIAALLDSLARQTLARERFEVVVVDDASPEPVRPGDGLDGLRVRVVRHDEPRGPAAARNTGWRAAAAPLIAFTDDDCAAAPGWLEAYLAAADAAGDLIVQGRTEPTEPDAVGPLSKTMDVRAPTGLFETCNVLYPRALLERVGGFDERFRRACGEDVDLALRALAAGGRGDFAPDALVRHVVHEPGLRRTLVATTAWTDAVRTLKLHPGLRPMLTARVFWKPTHPRLLLALAGVALAVRRGRPAVALPAAVPYLLLFLSTYGRSPQALRMLPARVAVDLCEVATMVAGSAEHRTLML